MSEVMREYVSRQYPGTKWREKVKKMPDNQVVCIYRRMLDKAENDEKERKRNQRKDDICGSENSAHN